MSILVNVDNSNPLRPIWRRAEGAASKMEMKLLEVPNVQNPTVSWARRHGCKATKLQGPGNRSEPDYIFRIPGGKPFLIEFKRHGKEPTPLQSETIAGWIADGYDVEVHDTKESAIAAITDRLARAHLRGKVHV